MTTMQPRAHTARLAAAALLLASPWALAQDANLARNLAATCANCHGTNGKAVPGDKDTTCKNWTSNNEGSAIVGHHDRIGLKDTRHMTSWNSSHGSAGCSNDALKKTGGNGYFYCFAAE